MNDIIKNIEKNELDNAIENSLRPTNLSEFIGQKGLKDNLKIFIESAKIRGESLDHTFFFGTPGLG